MFDTPRLMEGKRDDEHEQERPPSSSHTKAERRDVEGDLSGKQIQKWLGAVGSSMSMSMSLGHEREGDTKDMYAMLLGTKGQRHRGARES